jgi:formiminotetrahydrofolate cyclodeaminase
VTDDRDLPERTSYVGTELGRFLDLVASREPAPGGGAIAAVTVSLAAGLVAMAARFSARQVADCEALAREADQIRRRAADLAGDDADAYKEVLAASARTAAADQARQGDEVRSALGRAAEVPLEVTALGARTTTLAARLALEGNPRLHGDATTAALLAEAAVRAAAALVGINVDAAGGDKDLVRQAERHVHRSGAALRSLPPPP